jgi:hypothetical protein
LLLAELGVNLKTAEPRERGVAPEAAAELVED